MVTLFVIATIALFLTVECRNARPVQTRFGS
jgi:hypothetical protein